MREDARQMRQISLPKNIPQWFVFNILSSSFHYFAGSGAGAASSDSSPSSSLDEEFSSDSSGSLTTQISSNCSLNFWYSSSVVNLAQSCDSLSYPSETSLAFHIQVLLCVRIGFNSLQSSSLIIFWWSRHWNVFSVIITILVSLVALCLRILRGPTPLSFHSSSLNLKSLTLNWATV